MNFTAIDFELASSDYNSVCAVGIVNIVNSKVVNEYYTLVQPPDNKYMWQTTRVHGIKPKHTVNAENFGSIFQKIKPMLHNQKMIAHDAQFDRAVLRSVMEYYGYDYADLSIAEDWECTSKIYRNIGFKKTKLSICCHVLGIELDAHDALSDARACAQLYLKKDIAFNYININAENK